MISGMEFLFLINAIIMCGYVYEIGLYFYNRAKYPVVFAEFKAENPDFWEKAVEQPLFQNGAIFMFFHWFILSVIIQGINIFFVLLCCSALYYSVINYAMKPVLRSIRNGTNGPKPEEGPSQRRNYKTHGNEGFGFDPGRFGGASAWSTGEAEADYENALREAQKWVDDLNAETSIRGAINIFERKSADPKVHPKDKLRYKLAIMMLKEKLKPFSAGAAPFAST